MSQRATVNVAEVVANHDVGGPTDVSAVFADAVPPTEALCEQIRALVADDQAAASETKASVSRGLRI